MESETTEMTQGGLALAKSVFCFLSAHKIPEGPEYHFTQFSSVFIVGHILGTFFLTAYCKNEIRLGRCSV